MKVETRRTPARHRFTAADFERMGQIGILPEGSGYELIDGEVLRMNPIGDRHAEVTDRLAVLLIRALPAAFVVRVANPLVGLDPHWEPQPDLVIQRGSLRSRPTPQDAVMVIEVADTTLAFDRGVKLPAYAAAGIPEVWLIDLMRNEVFVHRAPEGDTYRWVMAKGCGEQLAPQALPDLSLPVDEILGDPVP